MRYLLLALLVAMAATACAEEARQSAPPAKAAPPQSEAVEWLERFEQEGAAFTFRVHSLEVLADGWRAEVSMTNRTDVRYSVDDPDETVRRAFGVMLFRGGDLREVEELNASGDLPDIRRAQTFDPELPLVLDPDETWKGTIGAPGSLAAGRWLRVVFGTLVPVGEPPKGFPPVLVWITDHAYRLEGKQEAA
jgi:hypothetical protein